MGGKKRGERKRREGNKTDWKKPKRHVMYLIFIDTHSTIYG